jgi:phosphomannomutase
VELFARLPERYSRAALIRQFPRAISLDIIRRYSPHDPAIIEVEFAPDEVRVLAWNGEARSMEAAEASALQDVRAALSRFFQPADGFADITRINYLDGIRLYFSNGDVAHLRPSGNADELRIYAVADTLERANAIALKAVAEPDGILRELENAVSAPVTI